MCSAKGCDVVATGGEESAKGVFFSINSIFCKELDSHSQARLFADFQKHLACGWRILVYQLAVGLPAVGLPTCCTL